jgi:regulator of protease activity HflC (stomatin/prohibitin superfamily)
MSTFIIGIIVLAIGIIVSLSLRKMKKVSFAKNNSGTYTESESKPYAKFAWIPLVASILVFAIATVSSCYTSIETGHTGVVTVFGKVENNTLDAGIHVKAPWQTVIQMDNRVQKATINLECFSSDIQEVSCRYTMNYQINKANAQEIYKTVGIDYYDTVITPNVAESVKTIMAHYTAENLVGNRDSLALEIEELLGQQLEKYNIEVVSTAIEDMDFTDEFTNAVEAKQVAVQNKLKATTEQEQKTMEAQQQAARAKIEAEASAQVAQIKAEAEAEVAKIQAQANLEVAKLQADATEYAGEKEAAKNKAISAELTEELLRYYLIQQWDGKYPETYVGSDGVANIILNSGKESTNKE